MTEPPRDSDSLPLWDGQEVPPDRVETVGDFRISYYRVPDGRRWTALNGPISHGGVHGVGTALFVVEPDGTHVQKGFLFTPAPTVSGWVSEN